MAIKPSAIFSVFTFASLGLLTNMASAQSWEPLFNGKDLTGWHTQPGGEWKVVDGVIVGTSASSERRHGLLVSDRELTNFILRAKFRVREGNSGLYFRAEETDTNVAVRGFQAEVDRSSAVGGLYETAMRGWVRKPDPDVIENIVTHGEWVNITVTAIDDDVTVSLNGTTVTELLGDKESLKKGRIALQLHGGQNMHVEFKDIAVLKLP
ncbi:MAG: DUF1080 domain-containing protein [Planctomycetota bacterium]|jgi:hypothetical protein|nr:DUF1080 domain-containing protein [Planctomycetota bacterium]MEC7450699.1 DUF1080 domain-containing protein [Planctomycetota bacterium]MEC9148341.1 DUF1080 domain-containing protein [Planctomycetota bacterium]